VGTGWSAEGLNPYGISAFEACEDLAELERCLGQLVHWNSAPVQAFLSRFASQKDRNPT
jgi:hypothetical protein